MADRFDEGLNTLVGGPWYDRLAFHQLVRDHVTGGPQIDPYQWRGWPRLIFEPGIGYRFDSVYAMRGHPMVGGYQ
jgi:hypothetical protein